MLHAGEPVGTSHLNFPIFYKSKMDFRLEIWWKQNCSAVRCFQKTSHWNVIFLKKLFSRNHTGHFHKLKDNFYIV